MSLPAGGLSSSVVAADLLEPDNWRRPSLLVDYELGGVALNDPSQGLQVQPWVAWSDGLSVWVAPYPAQSPRTVVVTGTAITELSLAFDQNMRPTLAFVDEEQVKLWWYDSLAAAYVITTFAGVNGPFLFMDDKREIPTLVGQNDVMLLYTRGGQIFYRQQRDRYGVEYLMGNSPTDTARIIAVGMGVNNRLHVQVADPYLATHQDLRTDTLYVVDGEGLRAMFAGDPQEAVWRSRVLVDDSQPSLAWAVVEGDYPVTMRLYADGDLAPFFVSAPITSNQPFRLPATSFRDLEVELRSAGRISFVRLASTLPELEGVDDGI